MQEARHAPIVSPNRHAPRRGSPQASFPRLVPRPHRTSLHQAPPSPLRGPAPHTLLLALVVEPDIQNLRRSEAEAPKSCAPRSASCIPTRADARPKCSDKRPRLGLPADRPSPVCCAKTPPQPASCQGEAAPGHEPRDARIPDSSPLSRNSSTAFSPYSSQISEIARQPGELAQIHGDEGLQIVSVDLGRSFGDDRELSTGIVEVTLLSGVQRRRVHRSYHLVLVALAFCNLPPFVNQSIRALPVPPGGRQGAGRPEDKHPRTCRGVPPLQRERRPVLPLLAVRPG